MIHFKTHYFLAFLIIMQNVQAAEIATQSTESASSYATAILESPLELLELLVETVDKLPIDKQNNIGKELVAQQQDFFHKFDTSEHSTMLMHVDLIALDLYGIVAIFVGKKANQTTVLWENTRTDKQLSFVLDEPVLAVTCLVNGSFFLFFQDKITFYTLTDEKTASFKVIAKFFDARFFSLSSSGKHFFTAHNPPIKRIIWASMTNPEIGAACILTESPTCADSDMSGKHAFVCSSNTLFLADKNALEFVRTIQFDKPLTHGRIDQSGTKVVVTSQNDLYCVDFLSGTIQRKFADLRSPVSALVLNGNGHYALIGNKEGKILIWDTKTNTISLYATKENPITNIAISTTESHVKIADDKQRITSINHCEKAAKLDLKTLILIAKARQFSLKELLNNDKLRAAYESLKSVKSDHKLFEISKKALTAFETIFTQCAVCLEKNASCKIIKDCEHKFCHDCLMRLIDAMDTCPLCRSEIRSYHFLGDDHSVHYKVTIE